MKNLPFNFDFYKKDIIKKVISANRALAQLNGVSQKIPNQNILINSLSLQEAKDSSEIENIVTTHDELYRSQVDKAFISTQTKEVQDYRKALISGYNLVKETKLLLSKDIINIQEILENNTAGFRTQGGTSLKNEQT
jgi:Fic family protein